MFKVKIFKCLRCGHEWASKQPHPRVCPKCKSPYWDKPRSLKESGQVITLRGYMGHPIHHLKKEKKK